MDRLIVVTGLAVALLLLVLPLARSPTRSAAHPGQPDAGAPEVGEAAAAVGRGLGALVVFVALLMPYVLVALVVSARVGPVARLDTTVEDQAHRAVLDSGSLLSAARGATTLGGGGVRFGLTALAVSLLVTRRQWRTAVFVAITVGLGALANGLLKALVQRARPDLPDPVASAAGYSFPSGHAMGAAILFGTLLLVGFPAMSPRPRLAACTLTAILVAAVAASRVLLGVHFLTDVVAGVLAGVAWIALCVAAFRGWHRMPATGP